MNCRLALRQWLTLSLLAVTSWRVAPAACADITLSPIARFDAAAAGDPAPAEKQFGHAIAVRGDWMFVGSVFDGEACEACGKVRIYHRVDDGPWTLAQTLLPDSKYPTQYFGGSIAAGDDFVAIGGSGLRDATEVRTGGVEIYTLSGGAWTRVARLTPQDPIANGRFGRKISLDGARLAIGSPVFAAPPQPSAQGLVYLFERTGGPGQWQQVKRIAFGPYRYSVNFGFAVALNGDELVAGDGEGAVSVFARDQGGTNQWGDVQTLRTPTGGVPGSSYIAFDGETIAVSPGETYFAGLVGATIDVFRRQAGQWTAVQHIPLDAMRGSAYLYDATSIALHDAMLVSGTTRVTSFEEDARLLGYDIELRVQAGDGTFQPPVRRSLGTVDAPGTASEFDFAFDGNDVYVGIEGEPDDATPVAPLAGAVHQFRKDTRLFEAGFE